MEDEPQQYLKKLRSNRLFTWMALSKIPSLWFWKIRIEKLDQNESKVSIPYNWRTKNPFRSIYFGALCGAAELSTGLLVLASVYPDNISILVTNIEASFSKKANQSVTFHCDDGPLLKQALFKVKAGEPQRIAMLSIGYLPDLTEVARVKVTWSMKQRSS